MFSLMQLTQAPHGLVVSYRLWTGLSLIALAAVLIAAIALKRTPVRRRWTMFAAVLIAGWSGLYFTTFKATITPQSATVYAFMRYDDVVSWKDAADVYLEQQAGDAHIVLVDRRRRALAMNVADLSAADRERLAAYMLAHIAARGADRAPPHLERQAPTRIRTVFSDQQT